MKEEDEKFYLAVQKFASALIGVGIRPQSATVVVPLDAYCKLIAAMPTWCLHVYCDGAWFEWSGIKFALDLKRAAEDPKRAADDWSGY